MLRLLLGTGGLISVTLCLTPHASRTEAEFASVCCLLLLAVITALQLTSTASGIPLLLWKSTENTVLWFSLLGCFWVTCFLCLSINSSAPDATCIFLQKWFSPRDLSTAVSQLDLEARHQRKATFYPTVFSLPLCPVSQLTFTSASKTKTIMIL